jgi:NAD-dependent aldehyde dehydrogenases
MWPLSFLQCESSLDYRVASASLEDVKTTVNNAQAVFDSGIWSTSSTILRSKTLSNLARILEKRVPDMAEIETLQTGRTIREMKAQLGRLPEWL